MSREKAELRIRNLPKRPRVLDLFCGNGEMYKRAYKHRAEYYHGLDKEKVHDETICTLMNNVVYINHHDINQYNVFDLDDYGSPWKQLYLILSKLQTESVTVFITDGLVKHQKVDGKVTNFVSGTERIPKTLNIPGLNRWYVDIFATMLLDVKSRYGWSAEKAYYFHNGKRTAYYWAIQFDKKT